MRRYFIPMAFNLESIHQLNRFQAMNPKATFDEKHNAVMYGGMIQWMSIFEILWPPFDQIDFYMVDVSDIVCNDPDEELLPDVFYEQIRDVLKFLWTIQLTDLYPNGDWKIETFDSAEKLIRVKIKKRSLV